MEEHFRRSEQTLKVQKQMRQFKRIRKQMLKISVLLPR